MLAVWTQQRRPAEICKELNVPANLLSSWQERALEGMLQALEPRMRRDAERGPLLTPRLEKLLERKLTRLESRLSRLGLKARASPEQTPVSP